MFTKTLCFRTPPEKKFLPEELTAPDTKTAVQANDACAQHL